MAPDSYTIIEFVKFFAFPFIFPFFVLVLSYFLSDATPSEIITSDNLDTKFWSFLRQIGNFTLAHSLWGVSTLSSSNNSNQILTNSLLLLYTLLTFWSFALLLHSKKADTRWGFGIHAFSIITICISLRTIVYHHLKL